MNERFLADRQVIDLMLAHAMPNKTESAHHRALHLERRRELAREWAELLFAGAPDANALLLGPRHG